MNTADNHCATDTTRPRAVIAVDMPEPLCERIAEALPEMDVVWDHSLYHPRRYPADWPGDPDHRRTEEEQAAYNALIDSADVLLSLPDVSPAELARTVRANPRLKWVHGMAAGAGAQLRAADLTREELDRLVVTTSAGVHGDSLAEFALFGVLAGAKDLARLQKQKSEHLWTERWQMRQIDAMTILVLGLGGIGSACARRFSALGARVVGTTRNGEPVEGVDELIRVEDLGAAVEEADAIVVTLPGTDATIGMVNAELLARCKPGVIVVNVGRGSVIDEDALIDALDQGTVGFAALDVFSAEPLAQDSPLWDNPNVLISPHTSGLDEREEGRIADLFIDNARKFLAGDAMRNVVDTVEFY